MTPSTASSKSVASPKPVIMSPRQLKGLQTGTKVNIFIGADLDSREILFSSVYKNILTNFSPFCHKKLSVEKGNYLWFPVDGTRENKETLKFVIGWMSAGGQDAGNKLRSMGVDQLFELLRLVNVLDIETLKEKTLQQFRGSLVRCTMSQTLALLARSKAAGIEAVCKAVSDQVKFRIRGLTPTIEEIDSIYQNTVAGSEPRKAVTKRIAFLVFYKLQNPDAYLDYSQTNKEFHADMDRAYADREKKAIEDSAAIPKGPRSAKPLPPYCGSCKQLGHREASCYQLHPDLIPRMHGCRIGCAHCQKLGHLPSKCLRKELPPVKKRCANCQKEGHLLANCFYLHPEKAPKSAILFACAGCGKPHGEESCWTLHPEKAPPAVKQKSIAGSHSRATSGTAVSLADYIKPAKVHCK